MRIIRTLGSIALWLGAALGLVAGSVWIAGQAGLIQPLIVISGSMEPNIMTGDLLLDRWTPTKDVNVGDVLTLPSAFTGKLVTHRVVDVSLLDEQSADALGVELKGETAWLIRMRGDANSEDDTEPYYVGDRVLTPWVRIPQGGKVVSRVMEPAVAMPVILALVALLGLSLLDEEPRRRVRRVIRRVTRRDPVLDELDLDLAAVGVDVLRLQDMDDLDLQLYSLGIDLEREAELASASDERNPGIRGLGSSQTRADDDLDRLTIVHDDGLWDFRLPPSDGVGLVPVMAGDDPPLPPDHPLTEHAPASPALTG